MKRKISTWAALLLTGVFVACEKGDLLNVTTQDLDLNENTAEYQEYIKERITDYSKLFRFEEAYRTLPKLIDPKAKAEAIDVIKSYHARALKEGCGYILASGDTLFLRVKDEDETPALRRTALGTFVDYPSLKNTNKEVKFWGLANFPALEDLYLDQCFVSEVLDLDKLPHLRRLTIKAEKQTFDSWFINRTFKPIDLSGYDLSKNAQLQNLLLTGTDITHLKAPSHALRNIELKNGIYTADVLNRVKSQRLYIEDSDFSGENLVIDNNHIDRLSIHTNTAEHKGPKLVDISRTRIKRFYFSDSGEKNITAEKIVLNHSLDSLRLHGGAWRIDAPASQVQIEGLKANSGLKSLSFNSLFVLLRPTDMPLSLEEIEMGGSGVGEYPSNTVFDFRPFTHLKTLNFDQLITPNLYLPTGLDSLHIRTTQALKPLQELDLSHIHLRALFLEIGSLYLSKRDLTQMNRPLDKVVLPATLERLEVNSVSTEVLDLSRCSNLKYLNISAEYNTDERYVKKIIFPVNLKQSNFKGEYDFLVWVDKQKVELVNYPSWVVTKEGRADTAH